MAAMGEGNRSAIVWLAETCKGVRKIAKVSQAEVAKLAGIQRSGIARFEEGMTWPRNPDRIVKAYALLTGWKDSRRLWRIAIGAWERYANDVQMAAKPRSADLASALDEYLQRKFGDEPEALKEPEERPDSEAA